MSFSHECITLSMIKTITTGMGECHLALTNSLAAITLTLSVIANYLYIYDVGKIKTVC